MVIYLLSVMVSPNTIYYRQVNPRPFRRGFTFIAVRFILIVEDLAISTERIKANAYVLCMCVSFSVSFC